MPLIVAIGKEIDGLVCQPRLPQDVRRKIVVGQRERLADFGDERTARELDALVAEFA